ncbi:MAG: glycosyltransferase family 4 protein [Rhodocyclaceae bacterium]|nr:glycosyltransferase family 4 protein [Rhodocyclaceae bacterium]
MKLAIVRQKYTPFGGAERFVERALSGLASHPLDVTIIAREWTDTQAVHAYRFLKVDPFYLGRTWRDVGFSHHIQRILAENRFDLVQSHERIPGCHLYRAGDGVHATWLELRNQARGGIFTHLARAATALSPWHSYMLETESALFRDPALRAVICNSHMVKADIIRRFGLTDEQLPVIYNGVDLDHFHTGLRAEHRRRMRAEWGIAETAPVILFVGSGFERKGVFTLLHTLSAVPTAHLVVVGRDKNERKAVALAQKLGLENRVRFLGGQKDVRPYYGMADVFALPAIYEPFPNAVIEAMACGLPVITSTHCGAAEVIESGKNGFVCDALDREALRRHLLTLSDIRLAAEMGETARRAVEPLSIAAMTQKLIELYRQLTTPC